MKRKTTSPGNGKGKTKATSAARGRSAARKTTSKPPLDKAGPIVVASPEPVVVPVQPPPAPVFDPEPVLTALRRECGQIRADISEAERRLQESLGRLRQQESLRQEVAESVAAVMTEEAEDATVLDTPPAVRITPLEQQAAPADDGVLPEVYRVPTDSRADDYEKRVEHLVNEAWRVEKELVDAVQDIADEVGDPETRAAIEEFRTSAFRHQENLETHLRSREKEPEGGKGVIGKILTRITDALRKPSDDADKVLQHVLKAYGMLHVQSGLYEALYAAASATGDADTADLAARHLRDGREAAAGFRPLITRAAVRSVTAPAAL